MIAPDKIAALSRFLVTLPEAVAKQLAQAVEVDQASGGALLPHDTILEALRPALRRIPNPERAMNPLRLFCLPFEDLLSSRPRKQKRKARIARESILPIWNWLGRTLTPDQLNRYSLGVKTALLGFRHEQARTHAAEFWPVAAKAIALALDTESKRKSVRQILGGDAVVADAQEIALLLNAAAQLCTVQDMVPRNTQALSEEKLYALRDLYDALVRDCADAAPYVAVIVMNRLSKPWMALKLPLLITHQTQDTLISATDMGLVGELLLGDLEEHAEAILAAKPQAPFDPEELVSHLVGFTAVSDGIVKEIEMRRDGKWGQRLMKDRSAVAEVLEAFLDRAPREIAAAIPTAKTGSYAGGPRAPDVSHSPNPEKTHRALCFAKLVAGCKPIAAAASCGAKHKDASDEISVALKTYCDDIVRELRTEDHERRIHAEGYFNVAMELTAILFSAEECEFLRRRGRAAMGYAVAA